MNTGGLMALAGIGFVGALALARTHPATWLALMSVACVSLLGAAGGVLTGGAEWLWRSDFLLGGDPVLLRLDAVSALFLVLLNVVGLAGAFYAREYWTDKEHPGSAPRGRLWWSAILLSMSGVLLASNGLQFLICWELFAVSAFFLLTLERERPEARKAGWLYLAASHVGTLCLFAFFASLAAHHGTWALGPMREQAGLAPLFWLAFAGFAVKAGLFPVHVWLPSAHANAPSHVSALMSGVAIKMGIYGLVRFSGWMPLPVASGELLVGLGALSVVLGIAFALAQSDLKRLLAYCSVENIGIIGIGLGGAIVALEYGQASWGGLLLAGALLHVWNHGLFKALLFMGAGSVMHATGTREMSRLGGLWRAMPWTATLFGLGAVAVCGLPPLNGFVSELLVYVGLFEAAGTRTAAAGVVLPAAVMLATGGALAVATFVKATAVVFLGAPRTRAAAHAHECGLWMRGAMVALGTGCVALAMGPAWVWPVIRRVVEAWRPSPAPVEAPFPFAQLGTLQAGLALTVAVAGIIAWRWIVSRGLRRGLTWDCGYAAPTARMQYTAGSFGGLAAGWFSWILRPERIRQWPRGLLPAGSRLLERVPETVLEKVVGPLAAGVVWTSTEARRLQHGRLQAYILYVVSGLGGLALVVWWGGVS